MTLVDLVVLAIVALAAVRGWRRGGTGLVLRVAGAVAGVLGGGVLARWLAPSLPFPAGATALVGALLGAMIGWALGRRLGEALARRGDGYPGLRAPGVPDRLLGVGAHALLALTLLVVGAEIVAVTGPAPLAGAAGESPVISVATQRLPHLADLLPGGSTGAARSVTALDPGAPR